MDSTLRDTGSQPPHTAANSIAATWAHAAASSIFIADCNQLILSPHEWLPAAASHTASVHEAVPQRAGSGGGGGGGDDGGEEGSGGEGFSEVQIHPSGLWGGGDDGDGGGGDGGGGGGGGGGDGVGDEAGGGGDGAGDGGGDDCVGGGLARSPIVVARAQGWCWVATVVIYIVPRLDAAKALQRAEGRARAVATAAANPDQCRALPARELEEGTIPRRGVAGTSCTVSVVAAVAALAALAALEDDCHQGVIRRIAAHRAPRGKKLYTIGEHQIDPSNPTNPALCHQLERATRRVVEDVDGGGASAAVKVASVGQHVAGHHVVGHGTQPVVTACLGAVAERAVGVCEEDCRARVAVEESHPHGDPLPVLIRSNLHPARVKLVETLAVPRHRRRVISRAGNLSRRVRVKAAAHAWDAGDDLVDVLALLWKPRKWQVSVKYGESRGGRVS
eukprot:scaffold25790_cov59-Phaeocystis_antarctica.AAC.8